jgi:hypothetical protein
MNEWWKQALNTKADLTILVLALQLLLAFALGLVVAGIHYFTARRGPDELTLSATLVLLPIFICMMTQVIGDSVARAFSVVGAVAIVRFRTIVEDTRDTAFVIFAVIEGMAAGSEHLWVALFGIVVGGAAAFLMKSQAVPATTTHQDFILTVRVGLGQDLEKLFDPVFQTHVESASLQSTATTRQGAALDLIWQVRLRDGTNPLTFTAALNRIEGVQGVELRRA